MSPELGCPAVQGEGLATCHTRLCLVWEVEDYKRGSFRGAGGPWEGLRHRDPQTGPTRWEEQKEVLAGAPAGAEAGGGVVDRI